MALYTSESVCAGHPDKICDQISDAILDAALTQNPHSRVAVETMVSKDMCSLAGEVTTTKSLDYQKIARNVIRELGYTVKSYGFSDTSDVAVHIHSQSAEIAKGVDHDGAGDQGMMYGYASRETANYMPIPLEIAHSLAKKIDEARKTKTLPYLRPDGKTQVTVRYRNNKPVSVESVVVAVPHDENTTLKSVKKDLLSTIIEPTLEEYKLPFKDMHYVVNGTGVWHIGGPASDTGVTGRKIVVDTYGGMGRIGGGAFSGKDPTKVDRSGAYAARFLAKNIVAQKLADKAEVRLAYFIGAKRPVMQEVETFGTAKVKPIVIQDFMSQVLDTSVHGIIEGLDLLRPIYKQTATYGHFGRSEFPWEQIKTV